MSPFNPDLENAKQQLAQGLFTALNSSPATQTWQRATLTQVLVGCTLQHWLSVVDAQNQPLPPVALPVDDFNRHWERIKDLSVQPPLGTWISATLQVSRDGSVSTQFNHDERIYAGDHGGAPFAPWPADAAVQRPTADDWSIEFARYPRNEMPAWTAQVLPAAHTAPAAASASDQAPHAGLHRVADPAAFYAAWAEDAVTELVEQQLGPNDFEADLETSTLTFTSRQTGARLNVRATVIASVAPGPRSLLWGWANPSIVDDVPANLLRQAGERDGIADLTNPELPLRDLAEDEQVADACLQLARTAAAAAVAIVTPATRVLPMGRGSLAVMVIAGAPLPRPTLADVAAKLPRYLAELDIRDHQAAFAGLAQRCGWTFGPTADPSAHQLTDGTSTLTVTFDELGRTRGLKATLQG